MHLEFSKDINYGLLGEKVILDDLKSLGGIPMPEARHLEFFTAVNLSDNRYDFAISHNGKKITYECKTDFYKDTGNLFVEIKCRDKWSGICVTKADWFVTYFKTTNEIWYIKTEDLKQLIKNNEHRLSTMAGDKGSRTKGYLIDKNKYREHFIVRKV